VRTPDLKDALLVLRRRAEERVRTLKREPGEGARYRGALSLAYRAAGDEVGARQAFPRASDLARKERDLRLQAALLGISRLYLNPDTAEPCIRAGLSIAEREGFREEEARGLNNLGLALMELRRLSEARDSLVSSAGLSSFLSPAENAVPLVNLACLALTAEALDEAENLLARARKKTAQTPALSVYVRVTEVILRARQGLLPGSLPELRDVAEAAASAGDPVLLRSAGFTFARAFLLLGAPEEALHVALVPPWMGNGERYARASYSKLVIEIFRTMGREAHHGDRVLERTTAVEAWLYRLDWIPPFLYLNGLPGPG
jgi:tetratricopeptide (TPR) repeat protein